MKFTGQIRIPDIDHPGIPATILIEDSQVEILLDGESLGRWSLYDVQARRLVSAAFQLDLDGEEVTFIADEPMDFAYRGVEHMAETWARIKAMRAIPRARAVRKSRIGVKPSRIGELQTAMEANLQSERRPRSMRPVTSTPTEEAAATPRAQPTVSSSATSPSPAVEELLAEERALLEDERKRLGEERARLEELRREAEERDARRIEAFRLEMARLETERAEHERIEAERTRRFREEMEKLQEERERLQALDATLAARAGEDAAREELVRRELERLEAARDEMERAEADRVVAAQREMAEVEARREQLERLEEERRQRDEAELLASFEDEAMAEVAEPGLVEESEPSPEVLDEEPQPSPDEPEPVSDESLEPAADDVTDGVLVDLDSLELEPEPALAGAGRERSGFMGAVRSAFTRGSRNHEHEFVTAPGGLGISRSICRDCGYVSITTSD